MHGQQESLLLLLLLGKCTDLAAKKHCRLFCIWSLNNSVFAKGWSVLSPPEIHSFKFENIEHTRLCMILYMTVTPNHHTDTDAGAAAEMYFTMLAINKITQSF